MRKVKHRMSKKFTAWSLFLAVVFMIGSTLLGTAAAKRISSIEFGQNVMVEGLESEKDTLGLVNFLLIGVDAEGDRSDTIMLFSVDGYSKRINILSIPRDTRVQFGSNYEKINASIAIGKQEVAAGRLNEPEELLIQKVKNLTGLPIDYFVSVDFNGFMEIIDALDGVEFNVPYDMDYDDPVQGLHIHLEAGQQHLSGKQAHDFVRFRHNNDMSAPGEYIMGDVGRIYWQQTFMKELIAQKLAPQYLARINSIFEVINRNVRTNFTMQDLLKYVSFIEEIDPASIKSYRIAGEDQYINGVSYYIYDGDGTTKLIHDVFLPRSEAEWQEEQAKKAAEATATPAPTDQKKDSIQTNASANKQSNNKSTTADKSGSGMKIDER